jgi:hypothetical protein
MSAVPLIATELVTRGSPSLGANSGLVHRSKRRARAADSERQAPPFVPAAATNRAILIGIVGGGKASTPIMLRLLDGSDIAFQRYTLGIR